MAQNIKILFDIFLIFNYWDCNDRLHIIIYIINFILGLRKSLSLWVPTCAQNFTDLCSFANISLFIFDGFQHGMLFY